jgi:hypothetical protein
MLFRLSVVKKSAAKNGLVDESRRALYKDAWPNKVHQVTNNISNQFETPVLFYVLLGMLWAIQGANILTLILSWSYVATRFIHANIHIGSNVVSQRRSVFQASVVSLIGLFLCVIWFMVV